LLIGWAVPIRFQTGFMAAGLGLWMIWQARWPWPRWIALVATAFAVQGLSAIFDRVGYGEWVWTVGNNFVQNVVHDRASGFGVDPWWAYFRFVGETAPPLGILVVLLLGWMAWKRPRDPFTWTFVPMLIAHSFVPHKELRFLFPLAALLPWAVAQYGATSSTPWRGWRRGVAALLFALNLAYLALFTFLPRRTEIAFLERFDRHFERGVAYVTYGDDPYVFSGLRVRYYARPEAYAAADLPADSPDAKATLARLALAHPELGSTIAVVYGGRGFLPDGHPLFSVCRREFASVPTFARRAPAWMGAHRLYVRELLACPRAALLEGVSGSR